ncbi:MAG: hypothetical protein WA833_04505 [Nitrosotalea sp.]
MSIKSILFEVALIIGGIVGLFQSWTYLNAANLDNYSQTNMFGFPALMLSGAMFAIGAMYLLADMAQIFKGKKSD